MLVKCVIIFILTAGKFLFVKNSQVNIARNRQAFQSTTRVYSPDDTSYAYRANDDNINIHHLPQTVIFQCSATSAYETGSWISIDLGKIYLITKVMVLSRDTNRYKDLKNFTIYAEDFPKSTKRNFCYYKENIVKRALSTALSYYETYDCAVNAIGSFLTVDHLAGTKYLSLCDLQVFGDFIKERDYDIIDYTNNKFYAGTPFNPNLQLSHLMDNNLTTFFRSRNEENINKLPFFRLDLEYYYEIYGLIVVGATSANSKEFSFIYKDGKSYIFKCSQPIRGQYILIHMIDENDVKSKHFFEFSELFVYGRKIGNPNSNRNTKDIVAMHESSIDRKSFLLDGIYISRGSSFELNQVNNNYVRATLSPPIDIKVFCITANHAGTVNNGIRITIKDISNVQKAYLLSGNYRYEQTVCEIIPETQASQIEITSLGSHAILEVEIFERGIISTKFKIMTQIIHVYSSKNISY
ncbi:DgyrCDS8369 [Dimorphilus gyrociliatus]|uniref:DgyrCDS8369 n=1 Tax=Dimorphilus gyrociliatus TaxID=2664684 RepID=A0A7I8VTX4_9ANNE|nr:DgyrCDS8369 [Dimorphilus gyrociliatus]